MSKDYGKPSIVPIAFDTDKAQIASGQSAITLSGKDVLGIVQSAYDELEPQGSRLIEAKRSVLEEVSEGRLAQAIRTAIVRAGKAGCTCCA